MHRKPTLYWTEKIVMAYLIQAASIHRRLPEVRVQCYQSLWPTTLKDEWERFYDMINGRTTLGSPMPPEVTFHEEVMDWLLLLDRRQQQLVWMRANKIAWRVIVDELGRSQSTLEREKARCLYQLTLHLNRVDPHGKHFNQLQQRANGFHTMDLPKSEDN